MYSYYIPTLLGFVGIHTTHSLLHGIISLALSLPLPGCCRHRRLHGRPAAGTTPLLLPSPILYYRLLCSRRSCLYSSVPGAARVACLCRRRSCRRRGAPPALPLWPPPPPRPPLPLRPAQALPPSTDADLPATALEETVCISLPY